MGFIDDVKQRVRTVVQQAGRAAPGVDDAAHWLWQHKGEIGFWSGTAALLAAAPIKGGAAAAVAGGRMATRGAALGARLTAGGGLGAGAVALARTAGHAVQGATRAIGATPVGALIARGNRSVAAGRVTLGSTGLGRAMLAAQKPLGTIGLGVGVVNLADTSNKFAHGRASGTQLTLSAIGVVPGLAATARSVAARQAARVDQAAARVVTRGLDDVVASTAAAGDKAEAIAVGAVRGTTVAEAGHAARAADTAVDATRNLDAVLRRAAATRAAPTGRIAAGTTQEPVATARDLRDHVDDVTGSAVAMRDRLRASRSVAGRSAAPVTDSALADIDHAVARAAATRGTLDSLAGTSERVKAIADVADRTNKVGAVTATYAGYAGNVRDSASLMRDLSAGNQVGMAARERTLALALASNLLKANAATGVARGAPG